MTFVCCLFLTITYQSCILLLFFLFVFILFVGSVCCRPFHSCVVLVALISHTPHHYAMPLPVFPVDLPASHLFFTPFYHLLVVLPFTCLPPFCLSFSLKLACCILLVYFSFAGHTTYVLFLPYLHEFHRCARCCFCLAFCILRVCARVSLRAAWLPAAGALQQQHAARGLPFTTGSAGNHHAYNALLLLCRVAVPVPIPPPPTHRLLTSPTPFTLPIISGFFCFSSYYPQPGSCGGGGWSILSTFCP